MGNLLKPTYTNAPFVDNDDLKRWDWDSKESELVELNEEKKIEETPEKPTQNQSLLSTLLGGTSNSNETLQSIIKSNDTNIHSAKYVINLQSINKILQDKYEHSHNNNKLYEINSTTIIRNWLRHNIETGIQILFFPLYCCYVTGSGYIEVCQCDNESDTNSIETHETDNNCKQSLKDCCAIVCFAPIFGLYESLRTVWIFTIPYILCMFWILSAFNIISDDINAMDSIVPFCGFLLFGQSIASKYAVECGCGIGCDNGCCSAITYDNVIRKMDHMKFLMANAEWKAYFKGNRLISSKNDYRYTVARYCVSFIFGLISMMVRILNSNSNSNSFNDCHAYCVFCVIFGFLFNTMILNHVLLNIVQEFFDVLKWFGKTMKQLTKVLVMDFSDNKSFLFLYDAENTPKWFELWSVIQIQGRRGFALVETNLLSVILCTVAASTILVYQYIFGYYSTQLTIAMLYLWIIFLFIVVYVVRYSKYYDNLQQKQLLLLTSQNQYINNLMLQIQFQFYENKRERRLVFNELNNKLVFYKNIKDLIIDYKEQIAKRTLSPTIMGLKFDKICYRFFVFFVVTLVPGLFNILMRQ